MAQKYLTHENKINHVQNVELLSAKMGQHRSKILGESAGIVECEV